METFLSGIQEIILVLTLQKFCNLTNLLLTLPFFQNLNFLIRKFLKIGLNESDSEKTRASIGLNFVYTRLENKIKIALSVSEWHLGDPECIHMADT